MSSKEKFSSCEHCNKPRIEGEVLNCVECWGISEYDGKCKTSYWLVCEDCYKSRQQWCENVFPNHCENCGIEIEYPDYYLQGCDQTEKFISTAKLSLGKTFLVVCKNCV